MKDMKSKTEVGSDTEFLAFRMHYLIVHIAIMLADGLQGTHLYVLYEGYGYSVASLYCLGFVLAALASQDLLLTKLVAAVQPFFTVFCKCRSILSSVLQHCWSNS